MEEDERVIGNRGPRREDSARWGGTAATRPRPSRCCSASPRRRSRPSRSSRRRRSSGAPDARTLRVGVEETTRVLTEAAISGKIDYLRGPK